MGKECLVGSGLTGTGQRIFFSAEEELPLSLSSPRPDWNLCSPPMAPLATTVVEKVRDLSD